MFRPVVQKESTGFIRLYTAASFQELLRLYGFKIKNIYGAQEANYGHLPRLFNSFDSFFSRFPSLAFQVIAVAGKESLAS